MIDATSLYPSMAPAAPEPAPQPAAEAPHYMADLPTEAEKPELKASTQEELEQALYPEQEVAELEIPDAVKTAREADTLRGMYPPEKQFAGVLNERTLAGHEFAEHFTPEMSRAVLIEAANIYADLGASAEDVRTLQVIEKHTTAEPTQEQRVAWHDQAVQRLNETYGKDATKALADARKFIAQDPRIAKSLEVRGRGDHPDTVLLFAKLARQARMAGKLK